MYRLCMLHALLWFLNAIINLEDGYIETGPRTIEEVRRRKDQDGSEV
jgi:hypothetical protein